MKHGVFIAIKSTKKEFAPYIDIKEDKKIVNSFIDALKNSSTKEINAYTSKHLKAVGGINIEKLKQLFENDMKYKHIENLETSDNSSHIKKHTILIVGAEIKNILHLYMIKEPDRYGAWKICAIERE